ncbi:MAG TPA: zf-HC2 domain-containing protein [Actinomycetes bacterium]|nr:zf-HC2 domain-containing protein [Actinomycetes bacterium]
MTEETRDAVPGMTITCQEVVELVTDYLEGELDDSTRAELEAHLALCPGCDAYLTQMRATIDELGHVPVESLSEEAQDGLMAAFRSFHAPGSAGT